MKYLRRGTMIRRFRFALLVLPFVVTGRVSATPFDVLVHRGDAAPDGNGFFWSFWSPVLNDAGQVAFHGTGMTGTSDGSSDGDGIFRADSGGVIQIARENQSPPEGNGEFHIFLSDNLALNEAGQVSFVAQMRENATGNDDNQGIYLGSGGPLTTMAREGQTAPAGNGVLNWSSLGTSPVLNDAGQVAFQTELVGTVDGNNDNMAVYRSDGGSLVRIAREGQLASVMVRSSTHSTKQSR